MPSTTEASARAEPCARLADQEQDQKSREADTNPRQPGATVRNAKNCKGFHAGAGLAERISYWNHQIFCVNWGCFISPQGSHALCNGKIVRQRYAACPRAGWMGDLGVIPKKGGVDGGRDEREWCPT